MSPWLQPVYSMLQVRAQSEQTVYTNSMPVFEECNADNAKHYAQYADYLLCKWHNDQGFGSEGLRSCYSV